MKLNDKIEAYSPSFQKFYLNYVEQPWGLIRRDVQLDFLNKLSGHELEMALSYLRDSLNEEPLKVYIIEALRILKDAKSLTKLEELLEKQNDFSWKIPIAKSIYQITGDPIYFNTIEEMFEKGTDEELDFFQYHFLEIKTKRSMALLISLLNRLPKESRHKTLTILNTLKTGKTFTILNDDLPYDSSYFLERRNEESFLNELLNHFK